MRLTRPWRKSRSPPETIPPNAIRTIIDLEYTVRDLRYIVEDIVGRTSSMEVEETVEEIRFELGADVLFTFDSADLRPAAEEKLTEVASTIRERGATNVRIEGHTDAIGSDEYNQALSERRAASVRDWLSERGGLAGANIATQGFGSGNPVAPNANEDGSDNPFGRQQNRRVEIVASTP